MKLKKNTIIREHKYIFCRKNSNSTNEFSTFERNSVTPISISTLLIIYVTCFISESDNSPSQDIGRGVFSSTALIFLLLIVTPEKSILLTSRSHSEPTSSMMSSFISAIIVPSLQSCGSSANGEKTYVSNRVIRHKIYYNIETRSSCFA